MTSKTTFRRAINPHDFMNGKIWACLSDPKDTGRAEGVILGTMMMPPEERNGTLFASRYHCPTTASQSQANANELNDASKQAQMEFVEFYFGGKELTPRYFNQGKKKPDLKIKMLPSCRNDVDGDFHWMAYYVEVTVSIAEKWRLVEEDDDNQDEAAVRLAKMRAANGL